MGAVARPSTLSRLSVEIVANPLRNVLAKGVGHLIEAWPSERKLSHNCANFIGACTCVPYRPTASNPAMVMVGRYVAIWFFRTLLANCVTVHGGVGVASEARSTGVVWLAGHYLHSANHTKNASIARPESEFAENSWMTTSKKIDRKPTQPQSGRESWELPKSEEKNGWGYRIILAFTHLTDVFVDWWIDVVLNAEMSHRSKDFIDIMDAAETSLRQLLYVASNARPNNYYSNLSDTINLLFKLQSLCW